MSGLTTMEDSSEGHEDELPERTGTSCEVAFRNALTLRAPVDQPNRDILE